MSLEEAPYPTWAHFQHGVSESAAAVETEESGETARDNTSSSSSLGLAGLPRSGRVSKLPECSLEECRGSWMLSEPRRLNRKDTVEQGFEAGVEATDFRDGCMMFRWC